MKVSLEVPCSKLSLAIIREYVRERLRSLNVSGKTADQIILATDEACSNCIIHQHQCDIYATIELYIYREDTTLYVEIKDTGKAFPLDSYQPKEIPQIVSSGQKGGLGIRLIQTLMDEIKIEERQDFFVYKLGKHLPLIN